MEQSLMDKLTYRRAMPLLCVITAILIGTLSLTSKMNRWFFMIWVCLIYMCIGGYYAMFPAVPEDEETGEPKDVDADDEEFGLVIMKVIEEDGEEILSTPDSDDELDEVYNLFMERFFEEEEEEQQ